MILFCWERLQTRHTVMSSSSLSERAIADANLEFHDELEALSEKTGVLFPCVGVDKARLHQYTKCPNCKREGKEERAAAKEFYEGCGNFICKSCRPAVRWWPGEEWALP